MKNKITVIDWLTEEEIVGKKCSVSAMGGWVKGHSFNEYLKQIWKEEKWPYLEAIYHEVTKHNLRIGGDHHQNDMIPLFSDGTIAEFSFRGWGDLMAAIWNEYEHTDKYGYMDFYMQSLVEQKC